MSIVNIRLYDAHLALDNPIMFEAVMRRVVEFTSGNKSPDAVYEASIIVNTPDNVWAEWGIMITQPARPEWRFYICALLRNNSTKVEFHS